MKGKLSRKEFMTLTAAGVAALLPGCDLLAIDPEEEDEQGPKRPKGKEAPDLAQQVTGGSLPPVQDRLPENPRVIQPVEGTGRYGGSWRTVLTSNDHTWLWTTVDYGEHLVHWTPQWDEIVPHVAESFETHADGREYVFTLRNGTKWSDGEPFTADDIVFWRDAVLANKDLTPSVGPDLGDDGKPFAVEKLDDYQVKITFERPHGLFLQYLAAKTPYFRLVPRHYLEQFHLEYNPAAAELADAANVPDWTELFLQKMDPHDNTELPRLSAWTAQNPWSDGTLQTWVRNPYYLCVDSEGSQLPYLDTVEFTFFNDPQTMLLSAAHGDVDLYMRKDDTNPRNKPVLATDTATGAYKLLDVKPGDHNTIGICFNLTHEDPVKREIFQNKDFRIGLSHAINRAEIIDVVFQRQGEPVQTSPRPEAPFYDSAAEEMATQFTDYDIATANRHLDRAGYIQRDSDGWRLGPDRRPISFQVLTQTRYPFMADCLELIQSTWEEIGIKMGINNVDSSLVGSRIAANTFDCTVDAGELGYLGMIGDPRWLFATGGSSFAPLWSNWFEGQTPNEEPPEAMKRQMELWHSDVFDSPALADQITGLKKIIEIARDEFWSIGISRPEGWFAIVKNSFRNVPGDGQMWIATGCPYPAVCDPEQFFVSE